MSLPLLQSECFGPARGSGTIRAPQGVRAQRGRPSIRGFAVATMAAVVACLAIIGAVDLVKSGAGSVGALRLLDRGAPGAQVMLASASVERRLGYVVVTGNVENRTGRSLREIEAEVELLDGERHTVRLEGAMVPVEPFYAAETAPFRVIVPDDSRAVAYRVRFRKLGGERLN